jgi:hypothetical protein
MSAYVCLRLPMSAYIIRRSIEKVTVFAEKFTRIVEPCPGGRRIQPAVLILVVAAANGYWIASDFFNLWEC